MRRILLVSAILLTAAAAHAQTASQAETDLSSDWQASVIAQNHVLKSLQAVLSLLQETRDRVKQLEAENQQLKAATPPPKQD